MKHWSTCACLLFFFSQLPLAYAQMPVYKLNEVDVGARPRGGSAMLETFLTANVRKPFMAQVANITGQVLLKATIEPNGQIADVAIQQSLRPDCDREAVRVIRLFNAWQPALKDGRAVRQAVTQAVMFGKNKPIHYDNGDVLAYYKADWKPAHDPKQVKYIISTPVDTITGRPNGDLVTYEMYMGQWSETDRVPLVRQRVEEQQAGQTLLTEVGHKLDGKNWHGWIYQVRDDKTIARERLVEDGRERTTQYHENGLVAHTIGYDNQLNVFRLTQWYDNGHLKAVRTAPYAEVLFISDYYQVADAWDSTGAQQVKKGNGYMTYCSLITSERHAGQKTVLTEGGAYKAGVKDGVWKGQTADSSFSYTERFDKGKDLGGEASRNGKLIIYKTVKKNPEFIGGHAEMYKFLSKTIKYPREASRLNISGRVYVAFTVCTDGSLCDFELLKGADPYLDEESLRVARLMNGKWLPGYLRGEPIEIRYNLPVSFKLEGPPSNNQLNVAGGYYFLRNFVR